MAKMKPMTAAVQQSLVQLAGGGPAAEMIFGEWYPALRAERLKRGETAVTTLLGISMLLGSILGGSGALGRGKGLGAATREATLRGTSATAGSLAGGSTAVGVAVGSITVGAEGATSGWRGGATAAGVI